MTTVSTSELVEEIADEFDMRTIEAEILLDGLLDSSDLDSSEFGWAEEED